MNISMRDIFGCFYHQPFFARFCHTLVYCLQKELKGCSSVLDLGCGPFSPLQYCRNIKYSVGVEAFKPYLIQSQGKKIHSKYELKKIEEVSFPDKSFDAVIMIEVLEHLSPKTGKAILKKAEKWAKKKIIISTPNGYFPMANVDNNSWQKHLSGWNMSDFKKLGFSCYGLAGVKFLYCSESRVKSMTSQESQNKYRNIKYSPQNFFYLLNCALQIFTYYFPPLSFELFAVKRLNE